MSRRKRGSAANDIYRGFNPNPNRDKLSLTEGIYLRILTELSVNRFKWIGLPPSVDARFLELMLFQQALAVFFWHKDSARYLALQGTGSGHINMYNNPTRFTVIGNTQVNAVLTAKECVPIWGNFMRQPDHDIVRLYASKLATIDRTIDINLLAMRHSHVLFVDENERQSYLNIMRQQIEGQPVIFGTTGLDMEKVQAFNIGIDREVVLNLMVAKSKIWNEAMTLLGINNSNQEKRERLVSDEVSANDEQVSATRGISLHSRQIAAEQINTMWPDLAISVTWNSGIADHAAKAFLEDRQDVPSSATTSQEN